MAQFQFPFQHTTVEELPDAIQQLIASAKDAAVKAYAPYSHFRVGAALRMNDDSIVKGNNHENAAYPAGVCAERAALSTLDMSDHSKKVLAIAITYLHTHETGKPLAPCGICRQTILEVQQWQETPIAIYMCSPGNKVIAIEDASYLMPFSFGSEYLQ